MKKTLNQLISEYTNHLKQGELQLAYKAILKFISKLRVEFTKKHPHYEVGSIYQGYMDMSYFPLNTKLLKEKGLKVAVVYLHEEEQFEVWLSGRNKEITKRYKPMFSDEDFKELSVFHDENNQEAIIECVLISAPNFEYQAILIDIIEQRVHEFISAVSAVLELEV